MLYQLEIKTHSNKILRYRPRSRRRKEICEPENSNKFKPILIVSGPIQRSLYCNLQVWSNRHLRGGFAAESSLQCDTWQQESDDSGDLFVLSFCLLLFCNNILGSKIQVTFLLIVFLSFLLFSSFDSLSFHLFVFFAMISLGPNIIHDLGETLSFFLLV